MGRRVKEAGIRLSATGTYAWKVRGFNPKDDAAGITGTVPAWTSGPAITVETAAAANGATPSQPDGMLPKDGEVVTAPNGTTTLTLQWNPVEGADHYVLYLGSSSASPVYPFTNVGNVTSMRVTLKPGNYNWTVTAVNAAGKAGPSSASSAFDVILNAAAPLLATATVTAANVITLTSGMASAPVAVVDIQHFDNIGAGATNKWSVYLNQPVAGNVVTVALAATDSGFNAGEYVLIRAIGADGKVSDYKVLILK